ncbi:hypothetical protein COCCADRAFT_112912 [Bipolaris zeicola 26-R-13]|uniref:Cytochrome P450 alkane hydroxylase n=1 Tax=Cochliobolus carbonum (strain 26-R-13) TaxID=930089 RepID=W6XW09_COCC2|nr:uncharacterized protein COCCADRAFT_112912 [Bipolaris zeicola 26-R-13]EUC26959.1 hypothetical protein COCCADRAFT_112912 [Bipolaris zeicola 26-R-13]
MELNGFSAIVAFASLLLLHFIASSLVLKWKQRQFIQANRCQPLLAQYPYKNVLFGINFIRELAILGKNHCVLEHRLKQTRAWGNTWSYRILGTSAIYTAEPENVKTMLSLKFKDYGLEYRLPIFGPLLGRGIFTTDGEHWSHSRAMIRPSFTRDQVADIDALEVYVQDLWKHIPGDGSTVDLQDLFFKFTIDSATEFLLGRSVHSLRGRSTSDVDFASAFNAAEEDIAATSRKGFTLAKILPKSKSAKIAIDACHQFVDQIVEQAMEHRQNLEAQEQKHPPNQRYIFLQELSKVTTDKKRIRDEILNVLVAGRDTTASLLSNMFFHLARRPDIWNKLKEEIGTLQGKIPTYSALRDLKYLKYCINEALRLYPVVPINGRKAYVDTLLPVGGGADQKSPIFVPKGTLVTYSVYVMQRRKDIFGEDADEFKPERWETIRPGWAYLPFNGGPRVCLGQQYAMTEALFVTARILQRFARIEPRDDRPWKELLVITMATDGGVKVGLYM